MFYLVCKNIDERNNLIQHLKENKILSVFHYQSLHSSIYYKDKSDGTILLNSDKYTNCLVRLPLFFELKNQQIDFISDTILNFFNIGKEELLNSNLRSLNYDEH